MGTFDLQPPARTQYNLDLRLVFAVEAVLGSEPLNCGIGCCLQVGSVRIGVQS